MVTVAVGQAIFSRFKVPPEGQKRLSDAISKLHAFSSYGQVLWFGFGIKHVLKTLCETEQGAACAAICACLSVSYDTSYSSQVLRELSAQSLTPTTLTPALSQWAALMNVCAGAVTDSQFPTLVEGFSSLVGFPCRGREIRPLQEPTNAKALAGALLELAKVSNGSTNSITFEGGADCGWIAAVAQWLFGLRLQILDRSGSLLYSNIDVRVGAESQVTIIQDINDGSSRTQTLVSSRSFLVPPGSLSFRLFHETLLGDSTQQLFSKGRSNWSGILYDTFGSSFHDLLQEDALPIFTSILCKAVIYWNDGWNTQRSPWAGYHYDIPSQLTAFLSAAAQQLPELQCVRHTAITDPNIFKDAEAYLVSSADLDSIRRLCICNNCVLFSNNHRQGKDSHLHFDRSPEMVCLERIVYTIFEFLWTLSWLDLHESIKPSSTGLTMMYYTHTYGNASLYRIKTQIFERGIGVGLFSLFLGLTSPNQSYPRTLSAAYENGLCIYQSLMLLDVMPLEGLKLRVLPGQIEFNERIYNQVSDQGSVITTTFQDPPSRYIDKIGVNPRLELLVEETTTSNQLKAKFQLQSQGISADYLGYRDLLNKAWDERWDRKYVPHNLQSIRPGMLWRNIILRSTIRQCSHSKVEVSLKQCLGLDSDLVSNVSWTGDCSEILSMGDLQWLPRAEEWILVDYSPTSKYIEVVRAMPIFIYYIVCNLDLSSRAQLVRPGKCFLCTARILRREQECIVIHSFLDDVVATAVEILCKDVNGDSQPVDSVPATSTPAPRLSPEPSAPSVPSISAIASRKRKRRRK